MHIRIDEEMRMALKIRAVEEKTTVKELVMRVMKEYLEFSKKENCYITTKKEER